jgi:toxin YoeB
VILSWATVAWEDYLYWQDHDRKKIKRINALLKVIQRDPFAGPGKSEPLRHEHAGYWSRRIDREHRLVYKVTDTGVFVAQCRYHYQGK